MEKVTKKFYDEFQKQHLQFISFVSGIPNENDKKCYVSVILNRLMFVYFLEKKGFLDDGDLNYLQSKLAQCQKQEKNIFYSHFLSKLFFEGFAQVESQRSAETISLIGDIKCLNKGLFVKHNLEEKYTNIDIKDEGFSQIFNFFERYSWNINDNPGGKDDEINPDILGYICEKYINQKQFGAYYTCPEITEYLCDRTINKLIIAKVNQHYQIEFNHINELLINLDSEVCLLLVNDILPQLKLLDPCCGSGAFLIAAMKTLINIYTSVLKTIEIKGDIIAKNWLKQIKNQHKHLSYYIKQKIIIDNLYGVDMMEEATEIAKLRLFLALVASVKDMKELEFLPNINFNIMSGNCLIGLININENQDNLNQVLLDEWIKLGIKYEEAQLIGKAKKRTLNIKDIEELKPFHWGYNFETIFTKKGGFDAIITNPPWEIFKPQSKEFFAQYSDLVTKNKMDIKTFEKQQKQMLENPEIAASWLEYQSKFPHVSLYYRSSEQYKNQISVVNGKKQGTDINLYKLFVEQCYNLLHDGGECGIVIPSGIYTDLGTKQLREMLFNQTKITGLFCLENSENIFEGVHKSFKFVILTFEKKGKTDQFPVKFMRYDVKELKYFPDEETLKISVNLIRKLSPNSLSIMEFKQNIDVIIAEKMCKFPLLGEKINTHWNVKLTTEFHKTNYSFLFKNEHKKGRLPLYEGKMIHQFNHNFSQPKYWIDEQEGRKILLGKKGIDLGQKLDYQTYRLGIRAIASNTNERTCISTILPPNVFCSNSILILAECEQISYLEMCFLQSILNSFVIDYFLRQKVSTNINMFCVYQLPIPRLIAGESYFQEIVEKSGKLICGFLSNLKEEKYGVINEEERSKIRAELDGIIAHLYGLTEEEFQYILSTFPLVSEHGKNLALEEFRKMSD